MASAKLDCGRTFINTTSRREVNHVEPIHGKLDEFKHDLLAK